MKPVIYEKSLRIPYYLGDRFRRANLPHLMNLLIEVSGEQITAIDAISARDLGLRWVVIQYNLNIIRIPNTNELVTIKTFIEEHNRIFSYRKFEVYGKENNLLLEVTAVFSLINEKRKLTRIPQELVEGFNSPEKRRIRRMPKPVAPKEEERVYIQDYKVRYFDIDTNFHANNSLYFIWMLDALGDEFLSKHEIISGNIVFEKEVHIGETVDSYANLNKNEEDTYKSHHEINVEGITKCVAEFEWKDK